MFPDQARRPGAADPGSPETRARLAAIHRAELRKPPRVLEATQPRPGVSAGPIGYRPQEVPVPDQTTPARPLPTGSGKTTLGRLVFRARHGSDEERAAARAEIERRRQAAGTNGGAA